MKEVVNEIRTRRSDWENFKEAYGQMPIVANIANAIDAAQSTKSLDKLTVAWSKLQESVFFNKDLDDIWIKLFSRLISIAISMPEFSVENGNKSNYFKNLKMLVGTNWWDYFKGVNIEPLNEEAILNKLEILETAKDLKSEEMIEHVIELITNEINGKYTHSEFVVSIIERYRRYNDNYWESFQGSINDPDIKGLIKLLNEIDVVDHNEIWGAMEVVREIAILKEDVSPVAQNRLLRKLREIRSTNGLVVSYEFAEKLIEIREKRGLSARKVASKIGVSNSTIFALENRKKIFIDREMARSLAGVFDLTLLEFYISAELYPPDVFSGHEMYEKVSIADLIRHNIGNVYYSRLSGELVTDEVIDALDELLHQLSSSLWSNGSKVSDIGSMLGYIDRFKSKQRD